MLKEDKAEIKRMLKSLIKSLENKPINFSSKELMLTYAEKLAKNKFGLDIKPLLEKSKLLKDRQKTLAGFI